jgi:predicted secreted protein
MAIFNGTLLGVYLDSTLIAAAQDVSLSLNVETIDVTTKDSQGFRELLGGLRSGTMTVNGLIDYTDADSNKDTTDLWTAWEARTPVAVVFQKATEVTGDLSFSANAIITSLEQSGGTEDTATYSATFELTGTITDAVAS